MMDPATDDEKGQRDSSTDEAIEGSVSFSGGGSRVGSTDTSSSEGVNAEPEENSSSSLTARCLEYFSVSDGKYFDQHMWTIEVRVNGSELVFKSDRSATDFVVLDSCLRKKFPTLKLPLLPFRNTEAVGAAFQREARQQQQQERRGSVSTIESSPRKRGSVLLSPVAIATEEDFDEHTDALTSYLTALLEAAQLLHQNEVLAFLDQEPYHDALDAMSPDAAAAVTVHDLLLREEPVKKMVVRKAEVIELPVLSNQYVLWIFETIKYDIGFGAKVNGSIKVAYTRVNSHEQVICGTLGVTDPGKCTLEFDNAYSKFHKKQLSYQVRVVDEAEFSAAKARALEIQRARAKQKKQRDLVRRCALRASAAQSGVIDSSMTLHDAVEEEQAHVATISDRAKGLAASNAQLIAQLQQAQQQSGEQAVQSRQLRESKEQLEQSWAFATREAEDLRHELQAMQESNVGLAAAAEGAAERITALETKLGRVETQSADASAVLEEARAKTQALEEQVAAQTIAAKESEEQLQAQAASAMQAREEAERMERAGETARNELQVAALKLSALAQEKQLAERAVQEAHEVTKQQQAQQLQLRGRVEALEQGTEELQKSLTQSREAASARESELVAVRSQLERVTSEREELQAQVGRSRGAVVEAVKTLLRQLNLSAAALEDIERVVG